MRLKRTIIGFTIFFVGVILSLEKGVEKFLRMQEERYRCTECGGVVCVHDRKCYSCNTYRKLSMGEK